MNARRELHRALAAHKLGDSTTARRVTFALIALPRLPVRLRELFAVAAAASLYCECHESASPSMKPRAYSVAYDERESAIVTLADEAQGFYRTTRDDGEKKDDVSAAEQEEQFEKEDSEADPPAGTPHADAGEPEREFDPFDERTE